MPYVTMPYVTIALCFNYSTVCIIREFAATIQYAHMIKRYFCTVESGYMIK